MARESGWLIERYYHSELRYFGGHTLRDWTADVNHALRFARDYDATMFLNYFLDGLGRVAEHIWEDKPNG